MFYIETNYVKLSSKHFTKVEKFPLQNLVFYVERAYRTPDFGMWGNGSTDNNGTCEVHAR